MARVEKEKAKRDSKGRLIKGEHNSRNTEFKPGSKQVEIAKKGADASKVVRLVNRLMKDVCYDYLNKIMSNGKTLQENLIEKAEFLCLDEKAEVGDIVKLLSFMRDTSGQKPVDKIAETDSQGNDLNFKVQMIGVPSEKESDEEQE